VTRQRRRRAPLLTYASALSLFVLAAITRRHGKIAKPGKPAAVTIVPVLLRDRWAGY